MGRKKNSLRRMRTDEFGKRNGYRRRNVRTREPRERFLIVCEGEKTEPNYFRSFEVSSAIVEVFGEGANTLSLVNLAIARKREAIADKEPFDQVWVVLDRDSFPPQNFNSSLSTAALNGIKLAYSNEAFELWYLLHFHFYNTGMTRDQYITKLRQLMGSYQKNDTEMYDNLLDKQQVAIANAERLLTLYPSPNPLVDNPSTTVFRLVNELNRFV